MILNFLISYFTMLAELLTEIEESVNLGYLLPIQLQILIDKINGCSQETLRNKYGICRQSLIRALVRTCSGRKWYIGMQGKGDTYLSDIDIHKFKEIARSASEELDCITACYAISIAYSLKKKRSKKARFILSSIGCSDLIENHIETFVLPPSKGWIKCFCESIGICIANSQTIEHQRRISCDVNGILSFFEANSIVLDRHPCLILNMDETMLSGRRKFKVLKFPENLPLRDQIQIYPHISAAITISAIGKKFDPFIILPNKKTMKNIIEFPDCVYVSSQSGWMTKKLFILYCIHIISQVQSYRLKLSDELKDEPFLLIVDGHPSRFCFYANYLLHLFNIDLLILPSHSSHVIQPFDVCVASPLKSEFLKYLDELKYCIDNDNNTVESFIKHSLTLARNQMIESFLVVLNKAATIKNIKKGFEKTGLFPIDPSKPITSKYIMPDFIQPTTQNYISSKFLNSEDKLPTLFNNEYHRNLQSSDLITDLISFVQSQWNNRDQSGWGLSKIPPIFVQENRCYLRLIC